MATAAGAPSRGARLSLTIPRGRVATLVFYIIRRILWMVPVLFFVILITFTLMHFAPGSPWDRTSGRQLSDAVTRNLNLKYGLNKPLYEQFVIYLNSLAHFDFGTSYQQQGYTVTELLGRSWPYTAILGTFAFLLIVPVGIGVGVVAALRQNTWVDYVVLGFATIGASVPNFVLGIVLIIVFSVSLNKWTDGNVFLPSGGWGSTPFTIDAHLIMPVVTLALLPIAYIARLTRSSTLDVLRQDYIRTAWSKGLRERIVVVKHALKNSLIPVVTALGPTFAFLITGSVIVESVFAIPGIGRSFVVAVESRDYPLILATTIQFSLVVAIANLIVDLLYVVIDPRVRLN